MLHCPTCDEFPLDLAKHTCPPRWTVRFEDDAEYQVYALDADHAAEKAAELYDPESDYTIASGKQHRVTVLPDGGGPVQTFDLRGEFDPSYIAYEVLPPEEPKT